MQQPSKCDRCGDQFVPLFSSILCPPCHEDEIDRKLNQPAPPWPDEIDRECYLDTIGG